MSSKPGMAKYAHYVGPHPSDPMFRTWWEAELARSIEDMKQATEQRNVRVVKIMSKRVKEAKSVLSEVQR